MGLASDHGARAENLEEVVLRLCDAVDRETGDRLVYQLSALTVGGCGRNWRSVWLGESADSPNHSTSMKGRLDGTRTNMLSCTFDLSK
jgi:hypothetical protein